MNNKQNLHTHTSFGDGAATPEAIVLAAMEMGLDSIGFSEHAHFKHSSFFGPRPDHKEAYQKDIYRLKEKYRGIFPIYCGYEVELYSDSDLSGFDYLIGSVHYLHKDGEHFCFDMREPERVRAMIDRYFGGSGIDFAKAYYSDLAKLPTRADFDIIGHFDLITKHPEIEALIDTSSKEYRNAYIEAAEALQGKIPYFEVNMGGVARGYKSLPYPSAEIISELKRLGFGAVITSDSHDIASLGYGFDDACRLLDACGFKERYILTDGGFVPVSVLE